CLEGTPIRADGVAAGVDRHQYLVSVGGGLADSFTLSAESIAHRGENSIQFGHVDLIQHPNEVLEDRVDLDAHVVRFDHRPGPQPCCTRVGGAEEVHVLGAECRGGGDLCADVGRDVFELLRVQFQLKPHWITWLDRCDAADLDAAQFHRRARFHHQTRTIRCQGHPGIWPEVSLECGYRQHDQSDDETEEDEGPQRRVQ